MFSAPAKRIKLLKEKNECSLVDAEAESGFHSEIDFSSSSNATTSKSIDIDYALSPVKRKVLATRRASLNFNQIPTNLSSNSDAHQSLGYSSLLLSSSSNLTSSSGVSSSSLSSRQSRTPKKRKSEISESDENFYNSVHFISPLKKLRRRDDKNCAKSILKEKCSSENVILSSTPIRTNTQKWQKFRSFHPEKITGFGSSSIDDDDDVAAVGSLEKLPNFDFIAPKTSIENSLNLSSFNLTNASFNLTPSVQLQQDIPSNIQKLWTDEIKPHSNLLNAQLSSLSSATCESQVSSKLSNISSTCSDTRKYLNGRRTVDILGRLNANNDIALEKILGYLDDQSLLNLSHVSQSYRMMIQKNKLYEIKRQNYLKATTLIKENKFPTQSNVIENPQPLRTRTHSAKKRRKPFSDTNENHMTLRHKKEEPLSPSSRFKELEKNLQFTQNTTFKKCPRCRRPATVKKVKIRNSPRKKKMSLYNLSPSTGRVHKRPRTFLSKTTIDDTFNESSDGSPFFVTLPNFDDDMSRSPNRSSSSSCESPNHSSGDESSADLYEYGVCGAAGCSYKFCVKCNCKYHPRQQCGDLSPPSPSRYPKITGSGGGACTRASLKSLRRLAY